MVRAMETKLQNIDYCRQQAREHDADRYYMSLFAPAAKRPALWALIAFNLEVSKTRAVVSETMLGEIRLQWWREALDSIAAGTPRAHPVVEALAAELLDFAAVLPFLDEVIDTWSDDFGGAQVTLASLEGHAHGTGGALNAAMLLALNPDADTTQIDVARRAGQAWSLMGTIRGLPHELANPSSDWQDLLAQSSNTAAQEETDKRDQLVSAIQPTVQRLLGSIGDSVESLKQHLSEVRGDAALRFALGLMPLIMLEFRTVRRVGDDLMALDKHLPGNARKLLALMKYHFFG